MKTGKKCTRVSISARTDFFNRLSCSMERLALLTKRRARALCTLIDLRAGQRVLLVGKELDTLKKAAQKRGCIVTECEELNPVGQARFDYVILFESAESAEKAAEALETGGRLTICALCGRYQANRLGGRLVSALSLSKRLCETYTVDVCVDTPTLFVISGRMKTSI